MNPIVIFASTKKEAIKYALEEYGANLQYIKPFYKLETEIEDKYNNQSYKECFHDLNLYFMEAEARTILKALNII